MTPAPRVALVTGATAGFGAAITRRLVRDGWSVVATGRRQARLDALAGELGEAVLPFALDVTDAEAVGALPAALPAAWRDVEALVNNAGLALGLDPAQSAKLADWDRMVAVNVTGVMHVTRALLPGMVARNRGHVVNLGSIAGTYPYPGGHVYGATKAFVPQFTLNLKADLVGTTVRVDEHRAGAVRRDRVLRRTFRWRSGEGGCGLCRHDAADRGGYRRDRSLGVGAAGSCQHQSHRDDADLPGERAADDQAGDGSVKTKDIAALLDKLSRHVRNGIQAASSTIPPIKAARQLARTTRTSCWPMAWRGCRPCKRGSMRRTLGVAGRPAGDGCGRQGRHDQARHDRS